MILKLGQKTPINKTPLSYFSILRDAVKNPLLYQFFLFETEGFVFGNNYVSLLFSEPYAGFT